MEPVQFEDSLILHERMISQVGKSIARVKKKLHLRELELHSPMPQPHVESQSVGKGSDSNNEEESLPFPQLREVKRDIQNNKSRADEETQKVNVKREIDKTRYKQLLQESYKKLDEFRRHRTYGYTKNFGGQEDGEPLKTIQNYNGQNCIYTSTRVLKRKSANPSYLSQSDTSLPPWIAPGYYINTDPSYLHEKPDNFYKLAFTSQNFSHRIENRKTSQDLKLEKAAITNKAISLRPPSTEHSKLLRSAIVNIDTNIPNEDYDHEDEDKEDNDYYINYFESPISRQSARNASLSPRRIVLGNRSLQHSLPSSPSPLTPSNNNIEVSTSRKNKLPISKRTTIHNVSSPSLYYLEDEDSLAAKLTKVELTSYDPWRRNYSLDALPPSASPKTKSHYYQPNKNEAQEGEQEEVCERDDDFYQDDLLSLPSISSSQQNQQSNYPESTNSSTSQESLFIKPLDKNDMKDQLTRKTNKLLDSKSPRKTIVPISSVSLTSRTGTGTGPQNFVAPNFPKAINKSIGPALKKWYEDNDIYLPKSPATIACAQFKTKSPEINLNGLLLPPDSYDEEYILHDTNAQIDNK